MAAHVALLKAVNLGGKTMVSMAALRDLAQEIGWEQPRTLMQSGNLVFLATHGEAALETALEAAVARRLDYRTAVFVRDAGAWTAAITANPFKDAAASDPSHMLLMTFKAPPPAGAVQALRAVIRGRESVEVRGREAYLIYPDGIGTSKLTTAIIEKHLGGAGTARNWNTVLKIDEAMRALD